MITGVEFHNMPATLDGVPSICDMSSYFLTRRIEGDYGA